MADMNVNYINPFLEAAIAIVKDACQVELKIGKPYAKMVELTEGTVVILIGVTGEMRGPELDDMAISAISELGNMIMGNAATVFSVRNIGIDITPPTVGRGTGKIDTMYTKNIAIPLLTDDSEVFMEMNIAMKIG